MAGKYLGKGDEQAIGETAGEHPREVQAADADLTFVTIDIVIDARIDKLP